MAHESEMKVNTPMTPHHVELPLAFWDRLYEARG